MLYNLRLNRNGFNFYGATIITLREKIIILIYYLKIMSLLKEISIKVSEEIAQDYQNISELEKQEIQLKINKIIVLELEKRKDKSKDKLGKLMDEISKKAMAEV